MAAYWDTSAILALVFAEPRSAQAEKFAEKAMPGYTSFFSLIEMESAYARRMVEGALKPAELPTLRLQAQRCESALSILWPDEETLRDARYLVLEQGLRPGDALQLASARLLARNADSALFVAFDEKLNQAAQAVGLSVLR